MAGQIVPRGEGVWLVRAFLGRRADGKRQYHNHTVHGTKKDAQTYLTGVLREKDLGRFSASRITVGDLLDDLLLDYKSNNKDYDWAAIVCNVHLRPFFGKMQAAKVGTTQIKQYLSLRRLGKPDAAGNRKRGAANATLNNELALLRRAFYLGAESDPPKVIRVPKIPKLDTNNVRKGFFEDAEFRAVRDALPDEVKPVVTFAYYTGCRRGEILGLQWSQVDLAERIVRLDPGTTKNDEGRVIPLSKELFETLAMQKAIRDAKSPACPWVFFRDGEPVLNFRKSWETACTAAKVDRVFHDLRRTGVRNLVRAGVPEAVAMRISGHKTRSVFDRYNIVSERDLKDAARKLDAYLEEKREATTNTEAGTQKPIRHTIGTQRPKASLQ